MSVSKWSGKRIAALWVAGLGVEALLFVLPVVVARSLVGDAQRVVAEQALTDSQWTAAAREDSISVAAQRREAILAGEFSVNSRGDTIVAVVRVPSGRPDSAAVVAYAAETSRQAWIIAALLVGAIPVTLLGITSAWALPRLRAKGQRI